MTRRMLLWLAGAGTSSFVAQGQYVLPPQAPPNEHFPPSGEQAAELRRKMAEMEQRLSDLRKKSAPDEQLVEVEIFHKAAAWIGRHNEYYYRNSVAQTLALLDIGLGRATELGAGKASWQTATGPVIRAYRSRVDGSAQPFVAYVPAAYNRTQPGRMDVILHGTNRGMVEVPFMSHQEIVMGSQRVALGDFLQIEVLGRTNNAYRWAGETDVLEAVEAAKRSYAVDPNRVVLRGFSMGGSGTWHLGLQHPDQWVAMEPGAGFNDTIRYGRMPNLPDHQLKTLHIYDSKDYALNVFQLPTSGYAGELDGQMAGLTNIREELEKGDFQFERDGLGWTTKDLPMIILVGPKTGHAWEPETKKRSDAFINEAVKKGRTEPDHIRFVTYTTRYNSCFWVKVDGLERHYERAEVNARRSKSDGTIQIQTKNVSALALTASGAKKITIDGKSFSSVSGDELRFHKRAGVWTEGDDTSIRKRHGLQGPIDDAFLESFLCVRPTGRAANDIAGRYAQEKLDIFADDYSKYFRGQVRIKDDSSVTPADIAEHHLILFGDGESNQMLGRVLSKLPIRWDARQLSVAGKNYDASSHTIAMIHPNPLDPRRYVVLNSGHSFHRNEMASTNAALFPRFGDYAVLRLRQPIGAQVESEIATAGFFNEQWKLVGA